MNKTKILLIAVLTVVLASCGGGKSGGKPNFGDNEYAVRTVQGQNADLQTTYPATIKGVQDVEIRPKVSGFITKLCVKEGQQVKAGQLLFVIDNVTYAAAVRQAKATVNAAKAQLNTARLTYNNSEKLFKNNVIGSYELQSSKNAMESAAAQLAQAEAAYISAKQNLNFCFVTSPANGVVGDLPYRVGALVSASSQQPLTTVSNNSTMQVYFSMTEKDLLDMTKTAGGISAAISSYPAVKLQLADGSIYNQPGKVATVSGVIDPTTGSVSMRADFPNPERVLKSGASGSIVVPHTATSAVVVPQDAVVEVQDKHFVYVVGKDNKVKYTEIKVNPQDDGVNYIVTSGLNVGDRIVAKGITKLSDGMQIKPITVERYNQKIAEAAKLAETQDNAHDFAATMSGKK